MDARRLRYLTEIIEQGSINKAAIALRLSQPALTKAIHQLEVELEAKLLERTPSGVTPTVYGKSLYAHAKAIEGELSRAVAEIQQLREAEHRHIFVGALPSAAAGIIPEALVALSLSQPNLCVRVVEKQNFELMAALRRGELDLAIARAADAPEPGLKQRTLFRDELKIVARPQHPLARDPRPRAADLAQHPWIFPVLGTSHRPLLEGLFRAAGVEPPRPKIECGSVQLAKTVLLGGDYLGVLPIHAMQAELRQGLLVALPVRSSTLSREIAAVYREHHPLSAGSAALIREIVSASRRLQAVNADPPIAPAGRPPARRPPAGPADSGRRP